MSKFRFTRAQRYAVWLHHEQRCWLCEVPLRLADVTVDHVIPESMEDEPEKLATLFVDYDLPDTFQINGYENWLPAHSKCNSEKSSKVFKMVPAYRPVFDHLIRGAAAVKRSAENVKRNTSKDKLLAKIASAIDENILSITDLIDFFTFFGIENYSEKQTSQGNNSSIFRLDNGYWIKKNEVVSEGLCKCNRQTCVGHNKKVYCYFPSHLSNWVQKAGLYHRCYDEVIQCPRCSEMHKRGYIGRSGSCGQPFSDQGHQVDTRRT